MEEEEERVAHFVHDFATTPTTLHPGESSSQNDSRAMEEEEERVAHFVHDFATSPPPFIQENSVAKMIQGLFMRNMQTS
jgi:hypothetical protein